MYNAMWSPALLLLLCWLADVLATEPPKVTAQIFDEKRFALSPLLYSIFFETGENTLKRHTHNRHSQKRVSGFAKS